MRTAEGRCGEASKVCVFVCVFAGRGMEFIKTAL